MKIVIIGGGAAGASAAARLRRLDEFSEIIILEKTNEISIANCGLPYYISDVINSREQMLVSNPDKFRSWFNIDVRLNSEVTKINRTDKTLFLKNGETLNYDKLLLAPGANPVIPDLKGIDPQKVFTVRTLNDADRIKTFINANKVHNALIIGGGFIGLEMAENFTKLGLNVTLIESANQILSPVDSEIAAAVQNEMRRNRVELILSDGIKEFKENEVILNSGIQKPFDIIIMGIGVRPEISLAKDCGLEVNRGILVNEFMQTSDENIFAAGDSIEVRDFVTDSLVFIPLAGPANRQGRIAADNIFGIKSTYKKTQGASVLKIFNLTVAVVGNNEKQLRNKDIPFWKTFIYGKSHAGYYPNSTPTLYKLLFTKEGKILGAQAVGFEGVEKRIDVISSIMRNGGTIQDMLDSELCYAPPYSSAKDPVNILGMNADNILRGFIKPAFYEDLKDSYLIDVRMPEAYKNETIEGASNLPINEIRRRIDEVPKDKKVILFCNTGYTSYCASRILIQNGFNNVYSLMGGIELYKEILSYLKEIRLDLIPKEFVKEV